MPPTFDRLLLALLCLVTSLGSSAWGALAPSSLSHGFAENKGQVRDTEGRPAVHVRFQLDDGAAQIFLLENGIAYQQTRTHHPEGFLDLLHCRHRTEAELSRFQALKTLVRTETYRMDMLLDGMTEKVRITPEEPLDGKWNYYGQDVLGVQHFRRVTYHDVYPGIDWVVYLHEGGIKYDFVVHPGADPSTIRMRSVYHEELMLDKAGSLIQGNRLGRFEEAAPVSFQDGRMIPTRFVLEGDLLSFDLSQHDPTTQLVIDPARIWGTYIGATSPDWTYGICTDASGHAYATGRTASPSAIANGGYQVVYGGGEFDAFLMKYAPDGTLVWGTYYGGDQLDEGLGCATDGSGVVYMSGATGSTSGIAFNGHQNVPGGGLGPYDAFLVKFDEDGTRIWATYYGGNNRDEDGVCATDPFGNVYLAGATGTTQPGVIAFNGHQNTWGSGSLDAFLVKFNASGVRQWGTYYGGGNIDGALAVGTDASGNVYMAGNTVSTNNISLNGYQNTHASAPSQADGFLVKFSPSGTRIRGTYYGGENAEYIASMAVLADGTVYVAGTTNSSTGIGGGGYQDTLNGTTNDAFLARFDSAGVRQWGTYYGGPGGDTGNAVAADGTGVVFLAGNTLSQSGIAFQGFQNTYALGGSDGFFAKFQPDGTRMWGSYYGGPGGESVLASAVDDLGNLFIGGWTSSNSSIADAGHQNTYAGTAFDGFLVKMDVGISTTVGEAVLPQAHASWPNPAGDNLFIQVEEGTTKAWLLDGTGRVCRLLTLNAEMNVIPVNDLRPGVYALRYSNGTTLRFVKE